jgi:hypothetical protein
LDSQVSGLSPIDWLGVLLPLAPVLLGGTSAYFGIFIESQKEFRARTSLKRQNLTEQLATKLAILINHSRSIMPDQVLRGDRREEPDLVGEYTEELLRIQRVFYRLELLMLWVRIAYVLLFVTTALGVVGFTSALLLENWRVYIVYATIIVILVQIITIGFVFFLSHRLEGYEAVA